MKNLSYRLLRMGIILLVVVLGVYFTYHAVYGTQGLRQQQVLQAEIAVRQADLQKLQAEQQALEKRTQGLRPESLDPDMIDEQARKQLGFGKNGETVVLTPQ